MTILQILQLLATLAGAAKDVTDVVSTLRAQGHADNAPIPPEHLATVTAALASVRASSNGLGDPYQN
jgi:hypothetical protein